jgi:hypothetical protein
MPKAHFDQVLQELDALESELEPMRLVIDSGEERFRRAPTARANAYGHLEAAMTHALESARALIEEVDWDSPEETAEAIQLLVEQDVVPERIGTELVEIAEFMAENAGDDGWESPRLYARVAQGADTLGEYVEYVHHFLKAWGE